MIKKTDIVREAIKVGDFKKALRIAKDFRINVSKEQRDAMTRAYECMVHERFYISLGENIEARIAEGIETVVSLYGTVYQEV